MDKIGKYVIEKKLGQGGMGIVYKCLNPETGQPAAVKVLPQQMAADPAFLQRFKREVITLQRLDHPNIVRIYDQGETDGAYYYAMEYVDGKGLDSVLDKREKMEPLRALGIIRACAEALAHSHAVGIIHRDIKPANIMLTTDDGVKLMDFGIAKVLDATRMTATQGVLGTVEYMSPEQSQGRHVDARSDLYSLGVVLYQCLTTRLPITGTTPTEIIMKLRMQQVDPPSAWVPELSRGLNQLVMRLLEKEATRRVESANELLRELDRVKQQIESGGTGLSVAAEPILADEPGRWPAWVNAWTAAFLLLIVIAGYWGYRRMKAPVPGPDPAPAAQQSAQESGFSPPVMMTLWINRARKNKNYELATDLCNMLIKHYSNTTQAEQAVRTLSAIEEDKAHDAAEKRKEASAAKSP